MAPAPVCRPTWTRRVPGWSFLVFFVSLILLTYLAVYFYDVNDLVSAGYLAGLASVVPVLLVVVVYYALPLWAMPVPLSTEELGTALAAATHSLRSESVADRKGAFAHCVSVVRFESPDCLVGWYRTPESQQRAAGHPRSTLVLRARTRDRKALAAFRETLARSLGGLSGSAQPAT